MNDNQELEKMAKQFLLLGESSGVYDTYIKAVASKIQAYVARQCREARIDELAVISKWADVHITAKPVITEHDNIPKQSKLSMIPLPYVHQRMDVLEQKGEK